MKNELQQKKKMMKNNQETWEERIRNELATKEDQKSTSI